jgi:hypothetical protein
LASGVELDPAADNDVVGLAVGTDERRERKA